VLGKRFQADLGAFNVNFFILGHRNYLSNIILGKTEKLIISNNLGLHLAFFKKCKPIKKMNHINLFFFLYLIGEILSSLVFQCKKNDQFVVLYVIYKTQIDLIVLPFSELNCLNPKSQNSNPKQISKYNESNSKRVWIIGAWNLGIVCYLVLGIFSIQGLNYTYISNTTYLTYLWDMTLPIRSGS
jgi:hypothetical protein